MLCVNKVTYQYQYIQGKYQYKGYEGYENERRSNGVAGFQNSVKDRSPYHHITNRELMRNELAEELKQDITKRMLEMFG